MEKLQAHILNVLFQVVVCLVVCSCRPPAATISIEKTKDSTYTREIPRLVPVFIPGRTVTLTEYIECDSITNKPKPASGSTSDGHANASFDLSDDGNLKIIGGCDSLKLLLEVKDKEITHLKERLLIEKKTEVKFKTRTIDKIARWIAIIFIVYIIFKIKKLLPV